MSMRIEPLTFHATHAVILGASTRTQDAWLALEKAKRALLRSICTHYTIALDRRKDIYDFRFPHQCDWALNVQDGDLETLH